MIPLVVAWIYLQFALMLWRRVRWFAFLWPLALVVLILPKVEDELANWRDESKRIAKQEENAQQ